MNNTQVFTLTVNDQRYERWEGIRITYEVRSHGDLGPGLQEYGGQATVPRPCPSLSIALVRPAVKRKLTCRPMP
jgi:hypothetical protein